MGFKLVMHYNTNDSAQYFFSLNSDTYISFFVWPEVTPFKKKRHGEPVKGPYLFDHLAFEVGKLQNLIDLQNTLVEYDIPISDIIDHGFIFSVYLFDPNGIPLEFNTRNSSVQLNQCEIFKDKKAPSIALEGANPNPDHWPPKKEDWSDIESPIIQGEGYDLFS